MSMHAAVRPRLWKAHLISEAESIGSFLCLHHWRTMSDQNFIFISQDSGFADLRRNGANNAFIRTSSDQHGGNLSSGNASDRTIVVFEVYLVKNDLKNEFNILFFDLTFLKASKLTNDSRGLEVTVEFNRFTKLHVLYLQYKRIYCLKIFSV